MKFKLISLNVWNGGRLMSQLIEFLKKENPDIITMQEVYDGHSAGSDERFRTIDVLKNTLGFKFVAFAPDFTDEFENFSAARGNAIFSRFPLTVHKTIFYDHPLQTYHDIEHSKADWENIPRNLQHVSINVDNKSIEIFNTHGIWGHHGGDTSRRLHMSDVIVEQVLGKDNVILTGDFNTFPETQSIENIGKILNNIFLGELSTTFNLKHKSSAGFTPGIVDMIFVSNSFRILKKYCPNVDVSDHLPLVCELEV